MTIDDITIEQGTDNPYADLGRPDADDVRVKAELAHQIAQILKDRHLTQARAAELLGMPQSEMLRGRFRGISQTKMIECLNRLGRDVDIVVRKVSRRGVVGQTHVVQAG